MKQFILGGVAVLTLGGMYMLGTMHATSRPAPTPAPTPVQSVSLPAHVELTSTPESHRSASDLSGPFADEDGAHDVAPIDGPAHYETYTNSRWGFVTCYLSTMTVHPESHAGAGRSFENQAQGAKLLVSGMYNVDQESLIQHHTTNVNEEEDDDEVSDGRVISGNQMIETGHSGPTHYWRKTLLQGHGDDSAFITIELRYWDRYASIYQPLTQQLDHCTHLGNPAF